jgi:hypothetical protein
MIDPIELTLLAAALSRRDDALREIEHQLLALATGGPFSADRAGK